MSDRVAAEHSINACTKHSSMHISNCLIFTSSTSSSSLLLLLWVDDCFVLICFSWCACTHAMLRSFFYHLLGTCMDLPLRCLFMYLCFLQPPFVFFVVKLTFYCWYCTIMWIYMYMLFLCGSLAATHQTNERTKGLIATACAYDK